MRMSRTEISQRRISHKRKAGLTTRGFLCVSSQPNALHNANDPILGGSLTYFTSRMFLSIWELQFQARHEILRGEVRF